MFKCQIPLCNHSKSTGCKLIRSQRHRNGHGSWQLELIKSHPNFDFGSSRRLFICQCHLKEENNKFILHLGTESITTHQVIDSSQTTASSQSSTSSSLLQSQLDVQEEKIKQLEHTIELLSKVKDYFDESQCKKMIGDNINKYDDKTREKAVNILCGGSFEQYNYLREKVAPLPHASTVVKWISPVAKYDGIITSVVEAVRMANLCESDRNGLLVLDETAISSGFKFDPSGQFIAGSISHDFTTSANINMPATKGLLFVFKSIFSGKKIPVAYFFTRDANGSQLKKVTTDVIQELEEAGLRIHLIMSDMASTNTKMFSLFGCNWQGTGGRVEDCSSVHPFDRTRRLFFATDPEHLIKNIRNPLTDGKKYKMKNTELVSIDPVRTMVLLEEKNIVHKVSNLSASDVFMRNSFAKMKVKPATDLFSKHTVEGLTQVDENIDKLNFTEEKIASVHRTLRGTREFIELMANWARVCFDGLDISEETIHILEYTAEEVQSMSYEDAKSYTLKPFQIGIKLFATMVKHIHYYLMNSLSLLEPVNIRHLNSACIENAFSQIKNIFSHPTASQFKQGVRWLVLCEMDMSRARNSHLGEQARLLPCCSILDSFKSNTHQMRNTIINIPVHLASLSSEHQKHFDLVTESALEWFSKFSSFCTCHEDQRLKRALQVTFHNLLDYLDEFKGSRPLSTYIFADRVSKALVRGKLMDGCSICNIESALIHKFIQITLRYLLERSQTPISTDMSSKSSFVATAIRYTKRPNQEEIDGLTRENKKRPKTTQDSSSSSTTSSTAIPSDTILTKAMPKTPFGNATNPHFNSSIKSYSNKKMSKS